MKPWQTIVLAAILLIGGFLRFYNIFVQPTSLWMDEIWSIESASGRGLLHNNLPAGEIQTKQIELTNLQDAPAWWHIWSGYTDIRQPPIYPILLRWWMDIWGNGPASVRALSAIISLLTILVFFDVCRWLHGPTVGLLGAALISLAVVQISTGQDTRNYVLAVFFSLCAADSLVRIEKQGVRTARCIALSASLWAMVLTNYLCIGPAVAMGTYAFIRCRWRVWLAFGGAAILAAIVWAIPFYHQMHLFAAQGPDFLAESARGHFARTIQRILVLPGVYLFSEEWAGVWSYSLLAMIAGFLMLIPIARLWWRRDLLLWVLWLLGTIGMVAALDFAGHTQLLKYVRYTVLAAPAVYAILASFRWPPRPIWRDGTALIVLAFMLLIAYLRVGEVAQSKEDWRFLAQTLDAHAGANDLLVFYGDDPWISPGMFYMGYRYYTPNASRPWLILHGPADAELLKRMEPRSTLWLIGKFPAEEGEGLLPTWRVEGKAVRTTAGAICHMIRPGS